MPDSCEYPSCITHKVNGISQIHMMSVLPGVEKPGLGFSERAVLEGVINAFLRNFKLRKDAISFIPYILDTNLTGIKSVDGHFSKPFEEKYSGAKISRRLKAIVTETL